MGNKCCQEKVVKQMLEDDRDSEIIFEMKDSQYNEVFLKRENQRQKLSRGRSEKPKESFYQTLSSYFLGELSEYPILGFFGHRILVKAAEFIHMIEIHQNGYLENLGMISVPHYGIFTDILFCSTKRCFYAKMIHFEKMIIFQINMSLTNCEIVIDKDSNEEEQSEVNIGSMALSYPETGLFLIRNYRVSLFSTGKGHIKIKEFPFYVHDFKVVDEDKILILEFGELPKIVLLKYFEERNKGCIQIQAIEVNKPSPSSFHQKKFSSQLVAFDKDNISEESINQFQFKMSSKFNYLCNFSYYPSKSAFQIELFSLESISMNIEPINSLTLPNLNLDGFRSVVVERDEGEVLVVVLFNVVNRGTSLKCFVPKNDTLKEIGNTNEVIFKKHVWSDLYVWGEEIFCIADNTLKKIILK